MALDQFQILQYLYNVVCLLWAFPLFSVGSLADGRVQPIPLSCLACETLHLVPKGGLVLVKAALSKCYYVRRRPDTGRGCLTGSTFFPLIALIRPRARTRLLVRRAALSGADRSLRGSDSGYQCEHSGYPRELMIPCWLEEGGRRR